MSTFAITRATLTRLLRDRTAVFFTLVLPLAVIIIVGMTVGGFNRFKVGVVTESTGPIGHRLEAELTGSRALSVHGYSGRTPGRTALRRSEISALVVIPADLDARAAAGTPITVPVLIEQQNQAGMGALSAVQAAVAAHAGRLQAARFAVTAAGGTLDQRLALADGVESRTTPITVRTDTVNGNSDILPAGFSYSTPTMLVLFVFVNSLAFGGAIIQTRKLGVYARALAAPVGASRIVLGETVAYLCLALLQSAIIMIIGSLLFGVGWGNPVAAAALVGVWALVGTGAGMLSGTLFRTPEQASSIGPTIGIAFGMLGGCMWPLAIVPAGMRVAGHIAPHAWAVDAWTALLSRNAGLPGIWRQLSVLAMWAVVLLALAAWRLRRRLTT